MPFRTAGMIIAETEVLIIEVDIQVKLRVNVPALEHFAAGPHVACSR